MEIVRWCFLYPRQVFAITVAARSKALSSLARTLGPWVRIILEAWLSLCAFILCLCCFVCRWQPCDGLIPRPRSPTDCV
jgi:hypothetical protein